MDFYNEETKVTTNPVCTGATVIAVRFDGGVAVAADRLASYGNMARYKQVPRLFKVSEKCLMGISGDYADFQFLKTLIEDKVCEMKCLDPETEMNPKAYFSWLSCVLYNRRSQMNPLYNTYLVGGMQGPEKTPFLGSVNLKGVAFDNPYIATGIGVMLVQEVLESTYRTAEKEGRQLSKDETVALLERCIETLFYRHCNAHSEFDIGIVTADGCEIREPKRITGSWYLAAKVTGYE